MSGLTRYSKPVFGISRTIPRSVACKTATGVPGHGRLLLFALLVLLLTMTGCVTRHQLFSEVDQAFIDNQYADAIALLEADQERGLLYNRRLDRVLYHFDLGILLHFDGRYLRSNEHFDEAERLIEQYYTKSITQAIGSLVLNDTVIEYSGEDFEDLYINLFKALNYIALQEYDSAFVEVRRMNNKIQYFETKYDSAQKALTDNEYADAVTSAQSDFLQPDTSLATPFKASALAYFLSMLLYAYNYDWDDAEIDYRALVRLFAQAQSFYGPHFPDLVSPQQWQRDRGDATRLVIIAFSGLAPEKVEESVFVLTYGFSLRISLPVLVERDSDITRVGLFDSRGTVLGYLELLESVEDVAMQTFERRKGVIYAKTIIRALTKSIAASASTAALHESGVPILGELLQIAALLSEQADLRTVRYLPARVYVYDELITDPEAKIESWEIRFLDNEGKILCRYPLIAPSSAGRLRLETVGCIR